MDNKPKTGIDRHKPGSQERWPIRASDNNLGVNVFALLNCGALLKNVVKKFEKLIMSDKGLMGFSSVGFVGVHWDWTAEI